MGLGGGYFHDMRVGRGKCLEHKLDVQETLFLLDRTQVPSGGKETEGRSFQRIRRIFFSS